MRGGESVRDTSIANGAQKARSMALPGLDRVLGVSYPQFAIDWGPTLDSTVVEDCAGVTRASGDFKCATAQSDPRQVCRRAGSAIERPESELAVLPITPAIEDPIIKNSTCVASADGEGFHLFPCQ